MELPFAIYVSLAARIPYTPRPRERGDAVAHAHHPPQPSPADRARESKRRAAYMRVWRANMKHRGVVD